MVELSNLSISQNNIALGYAGDTLNTAIYLKRILADRAVVDYLTVLGEDFLSDQMKRYIQFEGIGIDHIRHSTRRNIGIYAINNDTSGERTFTYWRDSSAARLLFQDETDFKILLDYDLIYFSGISLAILAPIVRRKLMEFLRGKPPKVQVAFDSNYRPKLWESPETAWAASALAFRNCDIALPSLADQVSLMQVNREETIVKWFRSISASQTVLKRGSKGPRLIGTIEKNCKFSNSGNVVDTTAAGDSFNAAFLAYKFLGESPVNSVNFAHQLANLVISQPGAICDLNSFKKFMSRYNSENEL